MFYSTAVLPAAAQAAPIFGDKRLDARMNRLHADVRTHKTVNIKQLSDDRAEQKAYYRVLCNPKVSEEKMIETLTRHCAGQVAERDVLVISDSNEINLQKHVTN